ncbi:hypothetical protein INT48_001766 [Thamnidium elegans]|uniref:Uncharacterized protein n=1 Tax=Thamnidium elegans TaxID=101142 RepID=A0A8H7SU13_9FUNG|nr:hypothetical protein INT48_001766 [Thamnidium elegans]
MGSNIVDSCHIKLILLLAQGISAQFLCGLFRPCTTPPVEEPPAATASNSALTTDVASSSVPSVVPSPTSIVSVPPSSSVKPSAPPSSASITPPPATTLSDTSSIDNDKDGGSNIGVIVGSVCGFVAIIGAGFAYAFFSKTRRNNRDKRLYTETGNSYPDNSYQPDHFNARPSPAIAASAVAAADQIHSGHQWDNQPYNYGNGAPQPPMATVTKQHDAYYSTAPVSQMGYSTSDTYYSNNNQQYYDPNAGAYYDPQQHHYDPNYIDSQKQQQHDLYTQQQQQHDPYLQKHQSPVLNQATIVPTNNVYSAPHSYSNENNPNSYR